MDKPRKAYVWFHFLNLDTLGEIFHGLGTGCEQDIAFTCRGDELAGQLQVVGVVEDQQPAGVPFWPAFDGFDD